MYLELTHVCYEHPSRPKICLWKEFKYYKEFYNSIYALKYNKNRILITANLNHSLIENFIILRIEHSLITQVKHLE